MNPTTITILTYLFTVIALFCTAPAHAETYQVNPGADLRQAINQLNPGDTLVLSGGEYPMTQRLGIVVSGSADAPIVIRSAEGERAIISRSDAQQNTIDVDGASHLVLKGLEIRGGSHGIRLRDGSSFVTIEACEVHETEGVAISANVPGSRYEGLRFIRNHIHHTGGVGEGFYTGCNNAECVMLNSVFEGNYIHHTNIGTDQGDGIEIKHGSYGNVVRDNVIHDTGYPCIIVYGTEGQASNIIERNVMWNCGDHGIQAASDAIIRNNIILATNADGIRSQPHQGAVPGNLVIVNNTILVDSNAIRANEIVGAVLIANNAVYSRNGSAIRLGGATNMATLLSNIGTGGLQGAESGYTNGDPSTDFAAAAFGAPLANNDFSPSRNGALIGAATVMHQPEDDFNGRSHQDSAEVGAHIYYPNGNPSRGIEEGFKRPLSIAEPPVPDAGTLDANQDTSEDTASNEDDTAALDTAVEADSVEGDQDTFNEATPDTESNDDTQTNEETTAPTSSNSDEGCAAIHTSSRPAPWSPLIVFGLWIAARAMRRNPRLYPLTPTR